MSVDIGRCEVVEDGSIEWVRERDIGILDKFSICQGLILCLTLHGHSCSLPIQNALHLFNGRIQFVLKKMRHWHEVHKFVVVPLQAAQEKWVHERVLLSRSREAPQVYIVSEDGKAP